jgi:hypothetical protein
MIPEFQENGYLPAGVHQATFEEIKARFGQETEIRRAQTESLEWLIDVLKRSGASRLVINGSFVTDDPEPNDVDCVVLIDAGFPRDAEAERDLLEGLPFLEIQFVTDEGFEFLVDHFFASDRELVPKGLVEVLL